MSTSEDYLSGVGFTADDHVSYIGVTSPNVWNSYGFAGSPTMVLLDRDGYIRKQSCGAIDGEPYHTDWQTVIEQLLGV
jgi:hypothetical protein